MMGYYGYGNSPWMWVVGTLMMLVFLGGLAALVVWVALTLTRRRSSTESTDEILRRRLAAGQISQQEYEDTRKALRS